MAVIYPDTFRILRNFPRAAWRINPSGSEAGGIRCEELIREGEIENYSEIAW